MRRGRIDAVALALLVVAPWVKPTLLGLPLGAFVGDAIAGRTTRRLAAAAAASVAIAIALHLASHGLLFEHVIRSNAQALDPAVWLDHVPGRLVFFLPLFGLAAALGASARRTPAVAIGLGALLVSVPWALVALAKPGSAGNYWMEPCVAAVALLAHAPGGYLFGRGGLVPAAATLGAILAADVASIRAALEHLEGYRRDAAFVATVRTRCGAAPADVVASDEQGIELALNGRILAPAFQMGWLVRSGRFPADVWTSDLRDPAVRCYVVHSNDLATVAPVAATLEAAFTPLVEEAGFRVLVKRAP